MAPSVSKLFVKGLCFPLRLCMTVVQFVQYNACTVTVVGKFQYCFAVNFKIGYTAANSMWIY